MWRGNEENHEWYPVLRILSEITIAVALIFMLLALTTQELGGLKSLVPHDLGNNFKTTDPEFNAMEQQMLSDWSFVLFAIMGWLWVSLMYGFAVLANKLLATQSQTLRPSLAIEPRDIPAWLLLLVIVSGGLAMLGQGIDRFTAETLFLILLMPYLLCGLAFIHTWSRQRHFAFRRLWLTCFYIVLICTRWPVLAVIAIGLYLQLAEILDRRQTPEKYHK